MRPSVLVVEDDPGDRDRIVAALRALGDVGEVVVASTADEALEHMFCNPAARPSLVLLDIGLTGRDGFEILSVTRSYRRTARTPVVVFTGSEDPDVAERALALGANGVVRKPDRPDALAEAARDIARYWLVWNSTGEWQQASK